jgi:hypothetical protein
MQQKYVLKSDGTLVWRKGAWVTDTYYPAGNLVSNDGIWYYCYAPHTSGASTEPGTGADWDHNWEIWGPAGTYLYIAYASDSSGTGFTLTFDDELDYIAVLPSGVAIPSPIASDFTGRWKNYRGAQAFLYIAYASDDQGTDFTLTFDASLNFIAAKATTAPIDSLLAGDFVGLWKNYKGYQGIQGDPGGEANHWATQETPSGTKDGANKSFTLAETPTGVVELWWGSGIGLAYLVYGIDYTNSGQTLTTITFAPNLANGDRFLARYPYA